MDTAALSLPLTLELKMDVRFKRTASGKLIIKIPTNLAHDSLPAIHSDSKRSHS